MIATSAQILRTAADIIATQHRIHVTPVTAIRMAAGTGINAHDHANQAMLALARHLRYGIDDTPNRFVHAERHLDRWDGLRTREQVVTELRGAADKCSPAPPAGGAL
ncbi:hypothetical protein AB0B89_31055 [Sphaerisporangium sp. NPDC049002]|uniref:DUF6197 family protein n=1 Tax=Sphaerisporangium sp. NPDC049002 TaxID=3155392 RepID=UPI00340BF617